MHYDSPHGEPLGMTEEEDRISNLPNDVLISIISSLALTEAVETSVLAHRWRYLWRHYTGILKFEQDTKKLRASEFIKWVNLVLAQHKAHTIDEFKLCYDLDSRHSNDIDRLIEFALHKQVKRLVLDFGSFRNRKSFTLISYTLTEKIFDECSGIRLTSLHLKGIAVTGEALGCILSMLPLLEALHVEMSCCLKELKIAIPLPNLRYLSILHCKILRSLEFHNARNLVNFSYRGPKISVYFEEVPYLVEANINEIFLVKNLRYFSSYFSRLESLVLDFTALDWVKPKFRRLPLFERLIKLELSLCGLIGVDTCTKLLKVSPVLHTFVLNVSVTRKAIYFDYYKHLNLRNETAKYQHNLLKVFKFVGFLGGKYDTTLVECLVAILPSLEKVVVTLGKQSFLAKIDAHALSKLLPPGVELVVES